MSQVFSSIGHQPNFYGRTQHCSREQICSILSQRLDGKPCLVTPSGVSAIHVALSAVACRAKNGTYLFSTAELYCDTPRVLKHIAELYHLQYQVISYQEPKETFLNKDVILFLEIVSNPNGYIFDIELLTNLSQYTQSLTVIVDNTWVTDYSFNPFVIPTVNYTISSLSKYYSGSTCIAGAIWSRNQELSDQCFYFIRLYGLYVAPIICDMLIEAQNTFQERMDKHHQNTKEVLTRLSHDKIIQINHPQLNNDCNLSHFKHTWFPVFTITCRSSKNKVLKVVKRSDVLQFKTSFGGPDSRIDPFPKLSQDDNRIITWRVAVGYETPPETIIEGLKSILDQL